MPELRLLYGVMKAGAGSDQKSFQEEIAMLMQLIAQNFYRK
jgi:hypothetical protein